MIAKHVNSRVTDATEDAATKAAQASLRNDPWLRDPQASRNAYRFNLMCACGLHITNYPALSESGRHSFTGEHSEAVIGQARAGDSIAHEALLAIAKQIIEESRYLPMALGRYLLDAIEHPPKKRPARHAIANIHRDQAIFNAVDAAPACGISPTRNSATKSQNSACSIVAAALAEFQLNMGELGVEAAWRERKDIRKKSDFGLGVPR